MSLTARDLRALTLAMPKAERHLHLDGSLRIDTALELARTRGVAAPVTFEGMRRALVAPDQVADQAELLLAFDLPIALMQDAWALERTAADLVEDKARENVRYAEIRWAPLLHVDKGLSGREVVEATWRGASTMAARTGLEVRLIATLLRSHAPERNLAFVEDLAANGIPDGLVAVDLAGQEARFPDPELHREAIERARAIGLHVTLHAGEVGGAAQVGRSLVLDPERIAHGTLAIEDPAVVAELIRRGVWLDLCPTSNTQANVVPTLAAHPLRRLAQAGVRVTLNTDDLTVSDLTLAEEYARAVEQIGVTLPELWALDLAALDAAFCDEPTRDRLRAEFLAWGAGIPELRPGVSGGTTIPLLILMFAMIITKPAEERAWRAGRISDRVAGWLIVLRLPLLALGFALITGRDPIVAAVMTGVGLVLAFVLAPVAVGRLQAVRARGRDGPP